MSFHIRQLRYAIMAADHGSFYRAARALDIEQSTLSRNILKLERAVGVPIFDRSRAGVTMTFAGDTFLRGARPMVASADKLVAMMRAAGKGRAGGLRLGHNSSVSAGTLRATMTSWHEAHPKVEVECVEADRRVLLAGLDSGEVDIAVLMGANGHEGFRCEPLWSERILVALPATHRLAERGVRVGERTTPSAARTRLVLHLPSPIRLRSAGASVRVRLGMCGSAEGTRRRCRRVRSRRAHRRRVFGADYAALTLYPPGRAWRELERMRQCNSHGCAIARRLRTTMPNVAALMTRLLQNGLKISDLAERCTREDGRSRPPSSSAHGRDDWHTLLSPCAARRRCRRRGSR